jgi:hypothetical protein
MSKERGDLGILGALMVVLIALGLFALAASYLGILPKY